jgi:cytoskeletal protein CcmA (bactofilin family)
MDKKADLVINGFGSSNGGQFHLVTLNGFGTVNSDVECRELESNGSGTVNGNIKAEKVNVKGKTKIKGNIESQSLAIDGTANIGGNVYVENVKIAGKASVGGKVKSEEIQVKGVLTVEEDCEAEVFKAESQFKVNGLLNADQIDILIYGPCKAKEIGGQIITVKKYKGSLIGSLFEQLIKTQLETELIEGDKIEIESTNAKIVRGNQIKIGPNCTIGLVEYTDEIDIDKNASVGESRKVK